MGLLSREQCHIADTMPELPLKLILSYYRFSNASIFDLSALSLSHDTLET